MTIVTLSAAALVAVAFKRAYSAWHRRVADAVRLEIRLEGLRQGW